MKMNIQEKVEIKLKELIEGKENYTHFYVGCDTPGISFKEFYGNSWKDIFNDMWGNEYINRDSIEDINSIRTEKEYLENILGNSNAYYYSYKKENG
jgi:hypothetical protein